MTSRGWSNPEKNDKLDIIQIKMLCSSKPTVKEIKRQATHLKQIFANHIPDKERMSKIQ